MLRASIQLYRNAYGGLPRSIWWLSLVIFVNRCGTMVIPFLTVYLIHKGYSLQQAGYIMAAFGAGSILGSYLGGIFSDRFGFFYVQVFSLLLNGILFFILGQMQSLLQIGIFIFLLSSLGEAFRPANSAAIAAYSNENNRIRCYSLNRLAINLGWAIGPALGGLLASMNYALLFLADGGTCILASILLYKVLKPAGNLTVLKSIKSKENFISAYKDKIFIKGMILVLLIAMCFFQLFSIVPVYYKTVVHLSESIIGLILALNGIIIVVVEMVLIYKIENRREPLNYVLFGCFLIGISFIILTISPNLIIIISGMLIVTFGEMFFFPFINNFWLSRSNEVNRGQYAAIYSMAFSIGTVIAPAMASLIAVKAGYPLLWSANFVFCVIASIGFLLLKRKII